MATQSVRIGWRPYVTAQQLQTANLLDSYSGAAAAYSLRKLRSSYSGSAIRVRRSSDNTELNIGFDSDGNLDTYALSAFVGSGNGFVTTWYDQSGSLRDITQSTAANQPKIVNAGSIYRLNGLPSVYFYDNFLFSSLLNMPINNVTNTTVSSSFTTDSLGWGGVNYQSILSFGGLSDYMGYATYYTYSNGQFEFNSESRFSNWNGQKTSTSLNKVNLSFNYHGYTQILSWLNSNSFGSSTFSNTNLSTQQYLTIGSRWHGSGFYFHLRGYVSEAIIWNNDKTSNRTQIESNINTYYSVYPNPSSVWNLLAASYNADTKSLPSLKTSLYAAYNGESNANDSKGTNNGTAQGGLTYTTGKIGNAFTFNGTNAYVSLPNSSGQFNFTGDFSISCWFKTSTVSGNQMIFSNLAYNGGVRKGFYIVLSSNTIGCWLINQPTYVQEFYTAAAVSINTWYHLSVTRESGVVKIYLNGTLLATDTNGIPLSYVTTLTSIGAYTHGAPSPITSYFNGSIDAFNIWQKSLTQSEIIELYNSGNGAQYITNDFYKPTTNDVLNTNNGTAQGGLTYTPGKVGTAFQFNGSNSFVRLPDNAFNSLIGDFSVSGWIYIPSSYIGSDIIHVIQNMGCDAWFNNPYGWRFCSAGNQLLFQIFNHTNTYYALSYGINFSTNTWYHVAVTRKSSTGSKLYINGSLVASDSNTVNPTFYANDITPTIGNLYMGTNGSKQNSYVAPNGSKVDAVSVWTKELSAAEITELYNSGNGKQYPN